MSKPSNNTNRNGAAALELAVTLPVLVFILVIAVDFGRLFYHYTTITNCARNGALYASDTFSPLHSSYSDYKQAAIADGQSLAPPLTVDDVVETSGTDSEGDYVEVTVSYNFTMVSSYLGFGSKMLTSTVRMRVAPQFPDF